MKPPKTYFLTFFLLCLHPTNAVSTETQTIEKFLETYSIRVEEQLRCITSQPMTDKDRFLVLQMENGYVQCIFHDNDTQAYCEASSGFYQTPQQKPTGEALNILKKQGFDISVTEGNYPLELPIAGTGDLKDLAIRMLSTGYLAYGAREGEIRTFGPFADQCLAIS